jgi:hypothetical protein
MIANLITEFAYLIRCKFAGIPLFISYIVFCLLKLITPAVIVFINLSCFVLNSNSKLLND